VPFSNSASLYNLPWAGWMPNTRSTPAVPAMPSTRSGSPPPMLNGRGEKTPNSSKDVFWARMSSKSSKLKGWFQRPAMSLSQTCTSRSGPGKGSGSSTSERSTLKMATLGPMPTARVNTITKAKPGRRTICRTA